MDNRAFEADKESNAVSAVSYNSVIHGDIEKSKNKSQNENNESRPAVELKREVGLIGSISLVVGTMIGSGIFVSPGGLLKRTGSIYMSLIVWGACGILSMFGALAYIELGSVVHCSGGEYSVFLRAFGQIPAFLFSWISTILLRPASLAIICLAFAQYSIGPFVEDVNNLEWAVQLLCAASILIITFINCYSVKLAIQIQSFFTFAKLLAIVVIIGIGAYNLIMGEVSSFDNGFQGTVLNVGVIAAAFYSGLWSYDGWNQLNYITEEIQNPYRNLPLALIIGLPLVTVCYILINVSFLTVLSPDQIKESSSVALDFGEKFWGFWGSRFFAASVAFSTFGAANGSQFTTARLGFVAAREGHLVDSLAYIDIKRNTPTPALIFSALLALFMAVFLKIEELIDFFSFTAWIFYGGAMLALIYLRKIEPNAPRPFKVWIGIPVLVFLISIYLIIAPIIESPRIEYLYSILVMLIGLFLYIPFVHYKLVFPGTKTFNKIVQKILNVAPEDNATQKLNVQQPNSKKTSVE